MEIRAKLRSTSVVNTGGGGGTGNQRISFDQRAFRKSLSPARRTVHHWPDPPNVPRLSIHYRNTNITNRILFWPPTNNHFLLSTFAHSPRDRAFRSSLSDSLSAIFFLVARGITPYWNALEFLFISRQETILFRSQLKCNAHFDPKKSKPSREMSLWQTVSKNWRRNEQEKCRGICWDSRDFEKNGGRSEERKKDRFGVDS